MTSVAEDATGLSRGASCLQLLHPIYFNVRMPRACPVEGSRLVARNVKLHGTRPWHLKGFFECFFSGDRETPRHKPVASFDLLC